MDMRVLKSSCRNPLSHTRVGVGFGGVGCSASGGSVGVRISGVGIGGVAGGMGSVGGGVLVTFSGVFVTSGVWDNVGVTVGAVADA